MKTSYQQFNSSFVKHCRERAKAAGIDMHTASKALWDELDKQDLPEVERIAYVMQCRIYEGSCVHLFVRDDAFLDWLVECVPTLADGSPDAMREMAGGKVCVFHFSSKSKYRSMACQFFEPDADNDHKTSVIMSFSYEVNETVSVAAI